MAGLRAGSGTVSKVYGRLASKKGLQVSGIDKTFISIVSLVCFGIAVMVHEVSHGLAAYLMGDSTAKDAKRLTLNPLRHIDPFGTVILPLMLVLAGMPAFGYAKPVPYNPTHFKNIKVGEVITGLAGPTSNLLMAFSAAGFAIPVRYFFSWAPMAVYVHIALYLFTLVNLCLMFFNLLPIPPLDGSSIIVPLLPEKALPTWNRIQRYSMPVLLLIIVVIPYITEMLGYPINLLSAYIRLTAYNLCDLLFSF